MELLLNETHTGVDLSHQVDICSYTNASDKLLIVAGGIMLAGVEGGNDYYIDTIIDGHIIQPESILTLGSENVAVFSRNVFLVPGETIVIRLLGHAADTNINVQCRLANVALAATDILDDLNESIINAIGNATIRPATTVIGPCRQSSVWSMRQQCR